MTAQDHKDIMKALREQRKKVTSSKEEALKLIDSLGIRHIYDQAAPLIKKKRKAKPKK